MRSSTLVRPQGPGVASGTRTVTGLLRAPAAPVLPTYGSGVGASDSVAATSGTRTVTGLLRAPAATPMAFAESQALHQSKGLAPMCPSLGLDRRPLAARAASAGEDGEYESARSAVQRPAPLRQKIESYFSNENLQHDRYLHSLITESPGGWVDVDLVLGLRDVRLLRAKRGDVRLALRNSQFLETWFDTDGDSAAVRRRTNHGSLPKLQPVDRTRITHAASTSPLKRSASVVEVGDAAKRSSKTRRSAPGATGQAVPGRRYDGIVKSFHQGIGLGFISCDAVQATYGRDVAVNKANFHGFVVGAHVSFTLAVDPEMGTPQALDLEAAGGCRDAAAWDDGEAVADDDVAATEFWNEEGDTAASQEEMEDVPAQERHRGVIKSVNMRLKLAKVTVNDYPGITEASVQEQDFAGFEVGETVSFRLKAQTGAPTEPQSFYAVELEIEEADE